MRARLGAAVLAGAAVVLVVGLSGWRQPAQGQAQPKPTGWEYKVVWFPIEDIAASIYGDGKQNEQPVARLRKQIDERSEKLTKQLNELGNDGWEYVGPVYRVPTDPKRTGTFAEGAFIVFKRPKR
jgi:hypothetical protein